MLSDDDWRAAYAHLLERVRSLDDANAVTAELQEVTRTRFENDLQPEQVERTTRRRRRSEEPFTEIDMFVVPVPVTREGLPEDKKASREDLDVVRNRAPTPREAFVGSVDVLNSRLRELPAIAARLQTLLERSPEAVQWRPDSSASQIAAVGETFDLQGFTLDSDSVGEIERALNRLQRLVNEES